MRAPKPPRGCDGHRASPAPPPLPHPAPLAIALPHLPPGRRSVPPPPLAWRRRAAAWRWRPPHARRSQLGAWLVRVGGCWPALVGGLGRKQRRGALQKIKAARQRYRGFFRDRSMGWQLGAPPQVPLPLSSTYQWWVSRSCQAQPGAAPPSALPPTHRGHRWGVHALQRAQQWWWVGGWVGGWCQAQPQPAPLPPPPHTINPAPPHSALVQTHSPPEGSWGSECSAAHARTWKPVRRLGGAHATRPSCLNSRNRRRWLRRQGRGGGGRWWGALLGSQHARTQRASPLVARGRRLVLHHQLAAGHVAGGNVDD